MRFTFAAILVGVGWWAIGLTVAPDVFLRRSPASLLVTVITSVLVAKFARPFSRRSVLHLAWITPASVYFAAVVVGYLLPLATERVGALERCRETIAGFCRDATFSSYGWMVFPGALLTLWLLRLIDRAEPVTAPAAPLRQEPRRLS